MKLNESGELSHGSAAPRRLAALLRVPSSPTNSRVGVLMNLFAGRSAVELHVALRLPASASGVGPPPLDQ